MDRRGVRAPGRFRNTAEAAEQCLRSSPYSALRGVTCECDHGVLLLSGHLPSFYYKQLAQEAVASVYGICQVINRIEVG